MSVIGKVVDGRIVLPPGIELPEGAEVKVETLDFVPEQDPFYQAALALAKPRPDWPADYALNHGHYRHGEPKKP